MHPVLAILRFREGQSTVRICAMVQLSRNFLQMMMSLKAIRHCPLKKNQCRWTRRMLRCRSAPPNPKCWRRHRPAFSFLSRRTWRANTANWNIVRRTAPLIRGRVNIRTQICVRQSFGPAYRYWIHRPNCRPIIHRRVLEDFQRIFSHCRKHRR